MNLKSIASFLGSREFRWFWLPALLWGVGILLLSGEAGSSQKTGSFILYFLRKFLSPYRANQVHHYLRFAGHVVAYGGLYILWFRSFREHGLGTSGRCFIWSLGICLAVALMDEGHQALVPSRRGSLRDVALDMAAAGLAALFTYVSWTFRLRRKSAA